MDLLPTETLTQIFLFAPTVSTAINLSSTCKRLHAILSSTSTRFRVLSRAAEQEFGPLDDLIQVITYNASQPAHLHRTAPLSISLLTSILAIGRVAQSWESLYPQKKWNRDYTNRRLLTTHERFLSRRALYRLWLFTKAFHTPDHYRRSGLSMEGIIARSALLHNFSTNELAEMLDVHNILRATIVHDICPSNSAMRALTRSYRNPYDFRGRGWDEEEEGFGDEIGHYYVIEDMLKLDPATLLFLRDKIAASSSTRPQASSMRSAKALIESCIQALGVGGGDWFVNNGETFAESCRQVVSKRDDAPGGIDWEEFREALERGYLGVAIRRNDIFVPNEKMMESKAIRGYWREVHFEKTQMQNEG